MRYALLIVLLLWPAPAFAECYVRTELRDGVLYSCLVCPTHTTCTQL